ncbi:flagella basal body P-ring formation protein FlgA [Phenylobacterium hankyongense]|uniref:Flagella basal body P-ring formation protein FlgA n=1 Tax=Phenylobacterium hankyongense TaxID=1813876 RepID=A0A328AVG8_9CAUL|nr:flagellar basal body P-ring formation chaperone FlgA [Phenylobacterium hankyongense]RAK58597.1 flagella basal body P-ring formation protein FlgA [Phenylobacterium hankyongense]
MRRLLALAACLCFASPALAGQAVTLKADTADADGVVTLGDLFDGAGAAGHTPVAARSGASVVLNAQAVQLVARRAGLDWANAEGLKTIVVHGGPAAAAAAAGPQRGNVDVLTYARNLTAGDVVQPTDLVWGKVAAAPSDAPSDPDAIIGLAAKRPLRAGAAVSMRDVAAAQVIKAGETVTVMYQAEGISLSLQGKALGAAGVGETLNVQNTASKRIIQAVVTGPGQAIVGPAAEGLKSARSTRYALR